jgi:hypothetical protein
MRAAWITGKALIVLIAIAVLMFLWTYWNDRER